MSPTFKILAISFSRDSRGVYLPTWQAVSSRNKVSDRRGSRRPIRVGIFELTGAEAAYQLGMLVTRCQFWVEMVERSTVHGISKLLNGQ